jgi:hypothetical protein
MSILRLIGAAAMLSVFGAAPALAQQVIQEPGYCAFFYPNANCQNKGPGNPYTDTNYDRNHYAAAGGGYGDATVATAPKRRVRKPAGMY